VGGEGRSRRGGREAEAEMGRQRWWKIVASHRGRWWHLHVEDCGVSACKMVDLQRKMVDLHS